MKSTIIRYGMFSAIVILILGVVHFFILANIMSYEWQEVVGYLTIFIATLFIFFGIRHYRDEVSGGNITFGQGMKIGILILLFPSLLFGVFDVLYTTVIDPSWSDEYFGHYVEKLKETLPAEEFEVERQKLEEQKALFGNPAFHFTIMFLTVFVIGLIVTIISSLTLRRVPANHSGAMS